MTESPFYSRTRDAQNIVVVDLGFLGDTIHLVPALWEIKDHYPQAKLHVVSAPVGAEVLSMARCLDKAWALTLDPAKRKLSEQLGLVCALRAERFDVAFNFGGGDRAVILAGLTGAKHRVAHAAGRSHFWNKWLIRDWIPRQDENIPLYEQRRQFLACCGFKLSAPRFDLQVDPTLQDWAATIVPAGALHVSVNSATPLNEWPVENYSAMLKWVWERLPGMKVVASSSAKGREVERVKSLMSQVNDPRLELLPPNLTISKLAAILKRCRAHLGPDSGVVHLAMALDVPTVAFFREQRGYRSFLPQGPQHRSITVPCPCLQQRVPECAATGRTECFARIKPEQIGEMVIAQFAGKMG